MCTSNHLDNVSRHSCDTRDSVHHRLTSHLISAILTVWTKHQHQSQPRWCSNCGRITLSNVCVKLAFAKLFVMDWLSVLIQLSGTSQTITKLSTTTWLLLSHLLSLIHENTSNWLLQPTAHRRIASWVHPTHAWCWAYWRWLHIRWASWLSQRYDTRWAYYWDSYRQWESFVWVYVRLLLIFTLRLIASQ